MKADSKISWETPTFTVHSERSIQGGAKPVDEAIGTGGTTYKPV